MATNPVLYPALVEAAVITYRDIKIGNNVNNPLPHFPMPSQMLSVVIVYGALAMIPDEGSKLASIAGWGFVVATVLNLYTPGGTVKKTNQIVNQKGGPNG